MFGVFFFFYFEPSNALKKYLRNLVFCSTNIGIKVSNLAFGTFARQNIYSKLLGIKYTEISKKKKTIRIYL